MKKILFVEDDVLIARVYSQKLVAEGFEVVLAQDGLVAVQRLREFKPDLVVLDLLMPRLTGVDVLKFMRQQPDLKDTRIIVFSNSFLSNLIEQVAKIGVDEALVKASVTPTQLVEIINKTLQNPPSTFLSAEAMVAHLAGHGTAAPPAVVIVKPVVPAPAPPWTAPPDSQKPAIEPAEKAKGRSEFETRAQRDFTDQVPAILNSVRQTCQEFLAAGDSPVEPRKLEDLRRKIGFIAQTLGMAGRHQLAQLSSALEAMLFELEDKPATITDSNRHTIASTVALLAERFDQVRTEDKQNLAPLKVLVVDDDAVSNRADVLALGRAKLAAIGIADPFAALKRLQENPFNLVLLDINMPGMDGITLCEQMRRLPLHKTTPVIFVTSRADFKTRARSLLSGGNDLIAKPVMPTELCVKALAHLLKYPNAEHSATR
jgi:CheY-like chemotaxis protein